ncbi:hypothetical protein ACJX0J_027384, partial [Zea mays]
MNKKHILYHAFLIYLGSFAGNYPILEKGKKIKEIGKTSQSTPRGIMICELKRPRQAVLGSLFLYLSQPIIDLPIVYDVCEDRQDVRSDLLLKLELFLYYLFLNIIGNTIKNIKYKEDGDQEVVIKLPNCAPNISQGLWGQISNLETCFDENIYIILHAF